MAKAAVQKSSEWFNRQPGEEDYEFGFRIANPDEFTGAGQLRRDTKWKYYRDPLNDHYFYFYHPDRSGNATKVWDRNKSAEVALNGAAHQNKPIDWREVSQEPVRHVRVNTQIDFDGPLGFSYRHQGKSKMSKLALRIYRKCLFHFKKGKRQKGHQYGKLVRIRREPIGETASSPCLILKDSDGRRFSPDKHDWMS